jgi:hypothetical protein
MGGPRNVSLGLYQETEVDHLIDLGEHLALLDNRDPGMGQIMAELPHHGISQVDESLIDVELDMPHAALPDMGHERVTETLAEEGLVPVPPCLAEMPWTSFVLEEDSRLWDVKKKGVKSLREFLVLLKKKTSVRAKTAEPRPVHSEPRTEPDQFFIRDWQIVVQRLKSPGSKQLALQRLWFLKCGSLSGILKQNDPFVIHHERFFCVDNLPCLPLFIGALPSTRGPNGKDQFLISR